MCEIDVRSTQSSDVHTNIMYHYDMGLRAAMDEAKRVKIALRMSRDEVKDAWVN